MELPGILCPRLKNRGGYHYHVYHTLIPLSRVALLFVSSIAADTRCLFYLDLQGFFNIFDFDELLHRMGQGFQSDTDIMQDLDDLSAMRKVHAAQGATVACTYFQQVVPTGK